MKKGILAVLLLGTLLVGQSFAQSGAVIPQGGAGHAGQASCVILKRMGPADEITSHLYSFGIRGKQFQYVEGKFPEGFPFHGRLTDHDVRNLQGRGAEVIVLNQNFTSEELKEARDDCRGETSKPPNQSDPKSIASQASPAPAAATAAAPAAAPSIPAAELANVAVKSVPDGADISVDGRFVGNTPSTLKLSPGDHTISVESSGFRKWQRTMTLSAGSDVTLNATLEKETGPQASEGSTGALGRSGSVASGPPSVGGAPAAEGSAARVDCHGTHGLALFAEPNADNIIATFACDDSLQVLKKDVGPENRMAEVRSQHGQHGYVYESFLDFTTASR